MNDDDMTPEEFRAAMDAGEPVEIAPGPRPVLGRLTLTEFLLARIAEDEASIHAGSGGRYGPDRIRVECEAKRRIVERMTEYCWGSGRIQSEPRPPCGVCSRVGCVTLRALALPYADHPDFDSTWKV